MTKMSAHAPCLVNEMLPPDLDDLIKICDERWTQNYSSDSKTLMLIPPLSASARYYTGPGTAESKKAASTNEYHKNHQTDLKGSRAESRVLAKMKEFFSSENFEFGGLLIYDIQRDEIWKTIPLAFKLEDRLQQIENEKIAYDIKERQHKPAAMRAKYDDDNKNSNGPNLPRFQLDILFIHPFHGIHMIEVKSGRKTGKKFNDNWKQAEKHPFLLGLLFYLITGETLSSCGIPLHFSICFPKQNFLILNFPDTYTEVNRLNFKQRPAIFKFKEFWTAQKQSVVVGHENLFEKKSFKAFVGALIGFRGSEFVELELNRMFLCKQILQQNLLPSIKLYIEHSELKKKMQQHQITFPVCTTAFGESITLTRQQKWASECTEQLQLMYGPPGSGKTLALLLQAWQRAKAKPRGTIYFLTCSELVPIIQAFFIEVHQSIIAERENRKLNHSIFIGNTTGMEKKKKDNFGICIDVRAKAKENKKYIWKMESDDDVFRDELGADNASREFLNYRVNCRGRTICAVTGGTKAVDNKHVQIFVEEFQDKFPILHQLNTVMRGSKEIVDLWSHELTDPDSVVLGHSRESGAVECLPFPTVHKVVESAVDHIKLLLDHNVPNNCIAVITQYDSDAKILQAHLDEMNMNWVTAFEQACLIRKEVIGRYSSNNLTLSASLQNKDIFPTNRLDPNADFRDYIVVDNVNKILSFEWPYVIVVPNICSDRSYSFLLQAASRAICYLKILQYDYRKVQGLIDVAFKTSFESSSKPNLTSNDQWALEAYKNAIKQMKLQFPDSYDELEKVVNFHRILTILRHNFIDQDIRFYETMDIIINDSDQLNQFLQDNRHTGIRNLLSNSLQDSDSTQFKARHPLFENEKFLTCALEMEAPEQYLLGQRIETWRSKLEAAVKFTDPNHSAEATGSRKRKLRSTEHMTTICDAVFVLIFGRFRGT